MQIILYKTKKEKENRLSKRDRFWGRRIIYPLMQVYAMSFNALDGLNFKINTTGYIYSIITFSAIEKLASIGG